MARSVSPEALGAAIAEELNAYHSNVTEAVNKLSAKAARELVKKTKATAPVGYRGSFRSSITSRLSKKRSDGVTYEWGAAGPDGRLTHLLVHGHATKDGGRTQGHSFLVDAMSEVLPEYERAVEEAIKNG